jgi:hypothetical protein
LCMRILIGCSNSIVQKKDLIDDGCFMIHVALVNQLLLSYVI